MSGYAYDGASPFDLTAAKAHGAVAISGYLVGNPGGYNPVDRARVAAIRGLGLGFVPNWERGAAYLVGCGRPGGVAAGIEAVVACRSLGVPDDGTVAVFFSWDAYVDPSLYAQCGVVADGIIAGLAGHYLFSAYGQGGLINYLISTGRIKPGVKGWLSMSEGFPGFNAQSPNVAMVQEHDASGVWYSSPVAGTDVNTITDPHGLHAWWPDNSPYGADMPLTQTEIQAVATAVWGAQLHAVNADGSSGSGNHPASAWLTGAASAASRAASTPPAAVDVNALAAQIVAKIGADLATQVAQAIPAHVQLAVKP